MEPVVEFFPAVLSFILGVAQNASWSFIIRIYNRFKRRVNIKQIFEKIFLKTTKEQLQNVKEKDQLKREYRRIKNLINENKENFFNLFNIPDIQNYAEFEIKIKNGSYCLKLAQKGNDFFKLNIDLLKKIIENSIKKFIEEFRKKIPHEVQTGIIEQKIDYLISTIGSEVEKQEEVNVEILDLKRKLEEHNNKYKNKIELLTSNFTGIQRIKAVKRILNFIESEEKGYFLVTGGPGAGKTTFMAYLAKKFNCPRYFIDHREIKSLLKDSFLHTIYSQLFPFFLKKSMGSFRNLLNQIGQLDLEESELKIIFVIDGLNEAIYGNKKDILNELPPFDEIPNNIFIIISSRPIEELRDYKSLFGIKKTQNNEVDLNELTEDIKEYLNKTLPPFKELIFQKNINYKNLKDQLLKSNFKYIKEILDAMQGKQDYLLNLIKENKVLPEIENYYLGLHEFFLNKYGKSYKKIIYLLSAIQGEISFNELSQLLEMPDLSTWIHKFESIVDLKKIEGKIAIGHHFGKVLKKQLDLTIYHKQIAQYYEENGRLKKKSFYCLNYLLFHLAEAKLFNNIIKLIENNFLLIKQEVFPFEPIIKEYNFVIDILFKVLQEKKVFFLADKEHKRILKFIIKFAFDCAKKIELTKKIPTELLLTGIKLNQLEKIFSLLPMINDPIKLILLYVELIQRSKNEEFINKFEKEIIRIIDSLYPNQIYELCVNNLFLDKILIPDFLKKVLNRIKNLNIEEAKLKTIINSINFKRVNDYTKDLLEIAKNIENPYHKIDLLTSIAEKFSSSELFKAVLNFFEGNIIQFDIDQDLKLISETRLKVELPSRYNTVLRNLEEPYLKYCILSSFSKKDWTFKKYINSLTIARSLKNPFIEGKLLGLIIKEKLSLEESNEAITLVSNVDDLVDKCKLLILIAKKSSLKDIYKKILKTAFTIENPYKRAKTLILIEEEYNNSEVFEKTLEIANLISDPFEKCDLLISLTEKCHSPKIFKELLQTSQKINNSHLKYNVLNLIIKKSYSTESLKEVLEVSRTIEDPSLKLRLIVLIATKINSPELIKEALKLADLIPDIYAKISSLFFIVENSFTDDILKEILNFTHKIKDEHSYMEKFISPPPIILKGKLIALIAEKIKSPILFEEAFNIVTDAKSDDVRLPLFPTSLVEKNFHTILGIVQNLQKPSQKHYTLTIIAEKIYSKGIFEEALKIARNIKNLYFKSRILINLAEKSLSQELFEEALNLARKNRHPANKSYLLALIAEKLSSPELFDEALKFAHKIKSSHTKSDLLITIAEKSSSPELFEMALEIANKIENPSLKSSAFVKIAEKCSDSGILMNIINSFSEINNVDKTRILFAIAKKHLNLRTINELFNLLNGFDDRVKSEIIISILDKNFSPKIIEKVLKVVKKIKHPYYLSLILILIAKKSSSNIYLNKVIEIAYKIEDLYEKSHILTLLTDKINNPKIINDALNFASKINDFDKKSEILTLLAEKKSSPQIFCESLQNACKIVIPIIKKGRLNFIINKIVKSNKFEDILKMIKDNKDPYLKSYALTIIGENISSNNLFIDALNFAYKIEVLDKKLEILSFIAEKSYSQQVLKIILNKIHEIDNPYYQSEILCLIGEKTSNSELINEALNVTYRIENSLEKSKILSFIATSKNLNLEIFTKLIKIGMITSIHTLMIIIIESIHFWNRFNLSFNQILPIFLRLINNK